MKRSLTLLLAASLSFVAACGEKDSSPIQTFSAGKTQSSPAADSADSRGVSLVRVVNAASDGKTVSVQLGATTRFTDVATGGVTDYREVASNVAQFSVISSGVADGTMLTQKDRVLLDGNRYTVFVITQDISKNVLRIVHDDVIPALGMARVRVIHAAPGGPEFDMRATDDTDKLFAGVNFKSEAGFVDVRPKTLALELRAAGEDRILLKIPAMLLRLGTATTVVVTGSNTLSYFTFTDALMKETPKP